MLVVANPNVQGQGKAPSALVEDRSWSMPAAASRLGALALDGERFRLFVAVPLEDAVWVLDTSEGRWLRRVQVPRPQVLWYEARPGLLYVGTDAAGGQIKILDVQTRRTLKTIGHLPAPVQILRDPPTFRLYAAYGEGALAVIHADTGVHTLSIILPGRPGQFALERVGHRIFVNLPRSNAVAIVDRLSREMTELWTLTGARENFAMALDEERARLFLGCAAPGLVLVWDTNTGREVTRLPVTGAVRWLFVDPGRTRLLAGSDRGECHTWQYGPGDRYEPTGTFQFGTGPASAWYDLSKGHLYVAVPSMGRQLGTVRLFRWRDTTN